MQRRSLNDYVHAHLYVVSGIIMARGKIELHPTDDPLVAYISMPDHPGPGSGGVVHKQIWLRDLVDYEGAPIYIDLDSDNRIVGIEVVG